MKAPLIDKNEIKRRHQLVDNLIRHSLATERIINFLSLLSDVERALSRISFQKANPTDLLVVAKSLLISRKIKKEILDLKVSKKNPVFVRQKWGRLL